MNKGEEVMPAPFKKELRREVPLLFVAIGDERPEWKAGVDVFLAGLEGKGLALQVVSHEKGVHGFDTDQPTDESKRIIEKTLAFFKDHMAKQIETWGGPAPEDTRAVQAANDLLQHPDLDLEGSVHASRPRRLNRSSSRSRTNPWMFQAGDAEAVSVTVSADRSLPGSLGLDTSPCLITTVLPRDITPTNPGRGARASVLLCCSRR